MEHGVFRYPTPQSRGQKLGEPEGQKPAVAKASAPMTMKTTKSM
jgi:hypothetical protein